MNTNVVVLVIGSSFGELQFKVIEHLSVPRDSLGGLVQDVNQQVICKVRHRHLGLCSIQTEKQSEFRSQLGTEEYEQCSVS